MRGDPWTLRRRTPIRRGGSYGSVDRVAVAAMGTLADVAYCWRGGWFTPPRRPGRRRRGGRPAPHVDPASRGAGYPEAMIAVIAATSLQPLTVAKAPPSALLGRDDGRRRADKRWRSSTAQLSERFQRPLRPCATGDSSALRPRPGRPVSGDRFGDRRGIGPAVPKGV